MQSTHPDQKAAEEPSPRPPLRAGPGPGQLLGIALAGDGILLALHSVFVGIFAHECLWKTSWIVGTVLMGPEVIHWPSVFDLAPITAALTALYPTALVCALMIYGLTHRQGSKGPFSRALCWARSDGLWGP